MAENKPILKKEGIVPLLEQKGLGELIKPLTNKIHLFDSFVAGTTYLKDQSVLGELRPGNTLVLRREENKFDEKAIVIFAENGKKVGYVPQKDNVIFSRLMDAGKLLSATVTSIEKKGPITQIGIGIYLVDF